MTLKTTTLSDIFRQMLKSTPKNRNADFTFANTIKINWLTSEHFLISSLAISRHFGKNSGQIKGIDCVRDCSGKPTASARTCNVKPDPFPPVGGLGERPTIKNKWYSLKELYFCPLSACMAKRFSGLYIYNL